MNKGAVTSVVLSLFAPLAAFAQDTENVNVLNANSAPIATLLVPRRGIQPSEIAVLINDNDPQSVDVANYYQNKRNIPNQNMIHLNFDQNKLYPGFMINSGIDPTGFCTPQGTSRRGYRSANSGLCYYLEQTIPNRAL
jgi:hypothetical protein